MSNSVRLVAAAVASALAWSTLPAGAKSKAFIKVGKDGVCVGGACAPSPLPVPAPLPVPVPSPLPLPIPIPPPVTQLNDVVTQIVDGTGKELGKLTGDAVREAGIGLGNLERESRRVGGQVDKNLRKGGNDVGMQLKRSQKDVGDLATAIYRYVLHETESTGKVANKFERRFREGKVLDALWHLGTDAAQETNKNAAEAALASEVLSTVGSVAATVYGGPGGAAAYAAWLTYHKTCAAGKCDPSLAFRTGLIAAVSTYANTAAAGVEEPFQRAAVMGAIAGAAVAASGGKPSDINDAFFRAGAAVLVQEGYKQYVKRDMLEESKGAFAEPMCMTTSVQSVGPSNCAPPRYMRTSDGQYRLLGKDGWHNVPESELSTVPADWKLVGDASSTPAGTPVVGIQTDKLPPTNWKYEGSPFMTTIAKIPGMNEMALFHDRWTVDWSMTSNAAVMGTIPVAMILTYTGDTLVYDAVSSRAIVDAAVKKNSSTPAATATPADPATKEQQVWLPQSIICDKGEQFKAFNVTWGTEANDLKCAVVVTTNGSASDEAPWYARQQADFCLRKIQDMAEPLLKDGWSCKGR